MAKIVIIAPEDAKDVDDAVKLLKAAGHEVETEEPTPKKLLLMVLGLLGPNAYGFGPGYAFSPGPKVDDVEDEPTLASDKDEPKGDATEDDELGGGDDDFNFESVIVDGEHINAVKTDLDTSVLVVEEFVKGPRSIYTINESKFGFWPANQDIPMQRIGVEYNKRHTSLEVVVMEGVKQELQIGKDLISLFAESKVFGKK